MLEAHDISFGLIIASSLALIMNQLTGFTKTSTILAIVGAGAIMSSVKHGKDSDSFEDGL